jgi:hypothetical protein
MRLRIAIDAHSVGAKLAGNESYAVNLIEALAEIDGVNDYTLYRGPRSFSPALAQLQSPNNSSPHTAD